ncbi:MAG: Rap1a/Tai family immunity protein [Methylophilaceae bacterium]|nr:Rap1a/Tai family immunity protein [Methylophilaceae bacterium]
MRLVLLLFVLFAWRPACAMEFETGGDLYTVCRQASDPDQRSNLAFGLCLGYIDGYISGYRFKREVPNSPPICDDIEQRSRRQVLKAVIDYLEDHPESQKELKSIAMYRALMEKLTCPGRQ